MTLPAVRGHDDVRRGLAHALDRGRLPGSLLFHGPVGVGRQRLGLWLGQRMVCEAPEEIEPCGRCTACRLALRLEHPDLQWFFPIQRPRSAPAEKMIDAVEDTRAADLEARRTDPHRPTGTGEGGGLYLAQVQAIRRLTHARPVMGRRRLVLIGDAEQLVTQEASPEAANALLKVLEEPPATTTFVLTAADPDALLPTIRSRLLPVRLRPLSDEQVAAYLLEERGVPERTARQAARVAQGAIGRALSFLPDGDDPGPGEALRTRARGLLEAALGGDPTARYAAASSTAPAGARGEFGEVLELLALWLRDLAAVAAGAELQLVNVDAVDFLRTQAQRHPRAGTGAAVALRAIDQARALGRINANPQLTVSWLLREIHVAVAA